MFTEVRDIKRIKTGEIEHTVIINDDTSEQVSIVARDRKAAERIKAVLDEEALWFMIDEI